MGSNGNGRVLVFPVTSKLVAKRKEDTQCPFAKNRADGLVAGMHGSVPWATNSRLGLSTTRTGSA